MKRMPTVRFLLVFFIFSLTGGTLFSEYVEREYKSEREDRTKLGTVYFAPGSFHLTPQALNEIKKIAQMLEIYTNYDNVRRIKIVGYADGKGDSDYNLHLGLARAEQLARALDDYGIVMENAVIASYGESKTALSEKNYRKAEVWLIPDPWGMYMKKPGLLAFFIIAGVLVLGFLVYWVVEKQNNAPSH